MNEPIICLGQQPCGFYPRRFLYAKLQTARRLREQIGGEIVFFFHDSDHDPRETQTILRHRKSGEPATFNFLVESKVQRKWSPLAHKRIAPSWHANTARQLGAHVAGPALEAFKQAAEKRVADFCLAMYGRLGLLDDVRIIRSSDPDVRRRACAIGEFFVDVLHEGEVVRARHVDGALKLHEGGDVYVTLPPVDFTREQISPTRDSRLRWMQSIIHCSHYITGAGEKAYLNLADAPEITFVDREPIERSDEAWLPES